MRSVGEKRLDRACGYQFRGSGDDKIAKMYREKWRTSKKKEALENESVWEYFHKKVTTPRKPSRCHGAKTGTNWPRILDINSLAPDPLPLSPPLPSCEYDQSSTAPRLVPRFPEPRTRRTLGTGQRLTLSIRHALSFVWLATDKAQWRETDWLEPSGHWENYFKHGVGDLENMCVCWSKYGRY